MIGSLDFSYHYVNVHQSCTSHLLSACGGNSLDETCLIFVPSVHSRQGLPCTIRLRELKLYQIDISLTRLSFPSARPRRWGCCCKRKWRARMSPDPCCKGSCTCTTAARMTSGPRMTSSNALPPECVWKVGACTLHDRWAAFA